MFSKFVKLFCCTAALAATSFAIPNAGNMIKLNSGLFTGGNINYTCQGDTIYYLEGSVVVPATCTLTIEPGCYIYGSYQDEIENTSILIIDHGILHAEGTADSPIVFTNLRDDKYDVEDFGPGAKGTWGGIVWIGDAPAVSGTGFVPEGIPDLGLTYGGYNPHHYGGKMKYVSIRHGGASVSTGSETNGLSLYGIGDATEISYVEVFGNSDDGMEIFGGTVNTHHMAMLFNNDDQFDMDDGHKGKHQFWFCIEQEYDGDRGGEWDGKHADSDTLCSSPTIFNFTFIGAGRYEKNNKGITVRDSMGGSICNGIITEFKGVAIDRNKQGVSDGGYDKIAKAHGAGLTFKGNVIWNCGATNTWPAVVYPASDADTVGKYNYMANPQLLGISHELDNCLDPRLSALSPAIGIGVPEPADLFFTNVNYVGAFDATNLWIADWTAAHELNALTSNLGPHSILLSCNLAAGSQAKSTSIGYTPRSFALEFHIENAPTDPTVPLLDATDSRFSIKIDGYEMSSNLNNATFYPTMELPTSHHRLYRVNLPYAGIIVPTGAKPVVGPHVIQMTFPLTDGTTTTVHTAQSVVRIY